MSGIRLDGIRVAFPGRLVFDDFSLTIPEGKITCLMGPSACGKTTLLRVLAGLLTPQAGRCTGLPVGPVSMGFQEPRLIPRTTATEKSPSVRPPTQGGQTMVEPVHVETRHSPVPFPHSA